MIAIPLGAMENPFFTDPKISIYEERKQPWVEILGDGVEHID
jgi:hypothetical protein